MSTRLRYDSHFQKNVYKAIASALTGDTGLSSKAVNGRLLSGPYPHGFSDRLMGENSLICHRARYPLVFRSAGPLSIHAAENY